MARYKQLSCPEEILQQRDDKGWSIRFPRLLADEVEPKALIEWCFGRVLSAACHYLNNSVLELNEGAYLLGEEDANTFVRAFRTAEGVPPACGREKQRSKAAS